MATLSIIVNILFALGVVGAVAGLLVLAIATQHHDHGVRAAGPLHRRRIWSSSGRPHAGPVRPWVVRHGQVWPSA